MLNQWPEHEKPREKLLNQGATSLSDAELIAIFLRTGVRGKNVVQLSHSLLNTFGSLGAIFTSTEQEFCQVNGLGIAKFVQLKACLEMSKRYLAEQLQSGDVLSSSQATKDYLLAELKQETNETFAVLLLNNQHQIISFRRLFMGTINAAAVYPRVVVEHALKNHAAAVILVHNHPSGVSQPSLADKQITQQLISALSLIEVKVLDHMIVAGNHCFSFAEHGLLDL